MADRSPNVQPIRRRRRREIQLGDPGIPGAENRWYPSRGQARKAALRYATQAGEGCMIEWNPGHAPGQLNHYHVVCPGVGRVSGHFYYGARVARKAPPDGSWVRQSRRERESDRFLDSIAGVLAPKLPPDLTQALFFWARTIFSAYGPAVWQRLVRAARPRLLSGRAFVTPKQAILQSAQALGIPVPRGSSMPGPLTRDRVRQMQLRQMQRLPSRRRKLTYRRQHF